MDTTRLIAQLNEILSWEWAGLVQYQQHAFILQGHWREVYAPRFQESADESLGHLRQIGSKIVSLGGVPTVERAEVKQAKDLDELLQYGLEMERKHVELYKQALALCDGDSSLQVLLEDILLAEQEGADDLEKILSTQNLAIADKSQEARKSG